jgi:hypothetical protein
MFFKIVAQSMEIVTVFAAGFGAGSGFGAGAGFGPGSGFGAGAGVGAGLAEESGFPFEGDDESPAFEPVSVFEPVLESVFASELLFVFADASLPSKLLFAVVGVSESGTAMFSLSEGQNPYTLTPTAMTRATATIKMDLFFRMFRIISLITITAVRA